MSQPEVNEACQVASGHYDTTITPRKGVSGSMKSRISALKGLGIVEMMIGIICIVSSSVLIIIFNNSSLTNVGYGIWGGLLSFIAGLLGVLVADERQNSKRRLLSATLNMSVIAACTSVLVITLSVMDYTERMMRRAGLSAVISNSSVYDEYSLREYDASIAVTSSIAILALVETLLSLVSSALSSQALGYEKNAPSFAINSQDNQFGNSETNFKSRFNHKTAKGLGITEIVIGIICVVINSVLIIFRSRVTLDVLFILGYGIWSGAIFFIAGFIGIFLEKNQNCSSGLAIGMIILACGGAAFAITMSVFDLNKLINGRNRFRYSFPGSNDTNYMSTLTECDLDIGGCFVIAFSALTNAILTLVGGLLYCKAMCCARTAGSDNKIPQPRPPLPTIPFPADPPAYEEPDAQGYQALVLSTDLATKP